MAKDLSLLLSMILFVDDSEANVCPARDADMQAIQYVDRQSFISELKYLIGQVFEVYRK